MFKHCLSKFSCALVMMCALVTGGLFQSCEDVLGLDEYKYDDSEPTWLGSSIYDFLKEGNAGHTYENYVKLIDDLGEKDILSRTGSRTLFIADDEAFARFYENNPWGVKEYKDFTYRQKKVLFYNVMLKNAYLLDMLAATSVAPNVEMMGGDCLRRETSATLYDSVPIFSENSSLQGLRFPDNNQSFNLWKEVFAGDSVRVAIGGKNPMMVHFLYEYVRTKGILDEDFSIIFQKFGKTRTGTEAFIFGNKILTSDVSYGDLSDDTLTITCKNGYLYRMDDVLIPPSTMAQVLRETSNTKLFSRMLDRFAYLEYDDALTKQFNALYHENQPDEYEKVYTWKYALETKDGNGNRQGQPYFRPAADGTNSKDVLRFGKDDFVKYDPGDAQYKSPQGLQQDMGAILVPDDEMIYRFFAPERMQNQDTIAVNNSRNEDVRRPYAVGSSIVETYANPDDVANLKEGLAGNFDYAAVMAPCLDSIPMDILSAFLCNLMQQSFLNTLPSNFNRVRNDARDEMGLKKSDVSECILANNGVIYILNNVYGPAKYQAVMTPPLVMTNMRIMNRIIEEFKYSSYLLAMDSKFSFIVPDDSCFVYYDPLSLMKTTPEPTAYVFTYGKVKETDRNDGLICTQCSFDPETYALLDTLKHAEQVSVSNYKSQLTDLMEYFIIVDEVEKTENQYFLSKGYGIVKCVKENGEVKFQGGEQIELGKKLGRDDVMVSIKKDGAFVEKNGVTYCTVSEDENYKSGVVSPPTRTIYSYLADTVQGNPFYEFYDLCKVLADDALYDSIYRFGLEEQEDKEDTITKYRIFSSEVNGYRSFDNAVPFLSTYHYTVYVPQASALQAAYEEGLPTYDDILAEISKGNRGRAASMMRLLNKFVRYHFQDNAVLVDKLPFQVKVGDDLLNEIRYETATIDESTGRFADLLIKSENGTITATDQMDRVASVLNKAGEEHVTWNILARDILYSYSNITGDPTKIETSSFAVVHQIDNVLYNRSLFGYDGNFCRFAPDGEIVNVWNGVSVPVSYNEADSTTTYEDQNYTIGEAKYKTANKKKTGYLLKPMANPTKFAKEEYVIKAVNDSTDTKILITQDGFLVDTLGTDRTNPIRFLRADFTPLEINDSTGTVDPDSIVTVLSDGRFVDYKGREIK